MSAPVRGKTEASHQWSFVQQTGGGASQSRQLSLIA
jgi:hypothetical protein